MGVGIGTDNRQGGGRFGDGAGREDKGREGGVVKIGKELMTRFCCRLRLTLHSRLLNLIFEAFKVYIHCICILYM